MSDDEPSGSGAEQDDEGLINLSSLLRGSADAPVGGDQDYHIEYNIGGDTSQTAPDADLVEEYRRRFGTVRTYFRLRSQKYADYQRTLNQARISMSFDEYLTRNATYAAVAGLGGALVGALLTTLLVVSGVLGGFTAPEGVSIGSLGGVLSQYRVVATGLGLTTFLGLLLGGATWFALYYYPASRVVSIKQRLNVTLPYAIVYMYAHSSSGATLTDVIRRLSQAEETYDEISRECQIIIRDVDVFGNDLYTALQNARNRTPSANLEQFFDDLLSMFESGGDVTTFLEGQARHYLEEAGEEQANFLETLAILSEVFIVGFVAAPLFLIVIFVVISLVGGNTLLEITLLVYAVIPFGMLMYIVMIDTFSEPFVERGTVDAPERGEERMSAEQFEGNEEFEAFRKQRQGDRVRELLSDPIQPIREEPLYSLAVTVPLALLIAAGGVLTGAAELSLDAFVDTPIATTMWLVIGPLLVTTVPLSVFFERRRLRQKKLAKRFPDALNVLASANKMGIGLTDGLRLVARSSSGPVARELERVRNDIVWNSDTSGALLSFGARVKVPSLARTSRLLAEGLESTGDLSKVLSIAAQDARARFKLEQARTRELSSYIAIVVIGYLVFMLVLVMLDTSYLGPIGEAAAEQEATNPGGTGAPLSFTNVPVDVYKAIFFHSAVIQGFGSGLLTGKLSDNSLLSGLKFGIALVVVAVLTFTFI